MSEPGAARLAEVDLPAFGMPDAMPEIAAATYAARIERLRERRRTFRADQLGIELHPDVLPLSNMPAHLSPFLLCPHHAMTLAG